MESKIWFRSMFAVSMFCVNIYSYSQVFIESTPAARSADPVINIYGAGNLMVPIPYEKVRGSAFWKDGYELACLYGTNSMSKWFCRSRLNLVTGEIYFLDANNQ